MGFNQSAFRNKHVVIVDDDPPSLKYYEAILKNAGAEVTTFSNGKEFSDFLELDVIIIDFVIMDFLIPFINGIDCTRLFRKKNRKTPIIMVTAFCSDQIRNEAFIAGCNDYILKPVFPRDLLMLMQKLMVNTDYVGVN